MYWRQLTAALTGRRLRGIAGTPIPGERRRRSHRDPTRQHRARAAAGGNRGSGRSEVTRDGNVHGVPVSGDTGVVRDQPAARPAGWPPPFKAAGPADVERVTVDQFGPLVRTVDLVDAWRRPAARPAGIEPTSSRVRPRPGRGGRRPAQEARASSRVGGRKPGLDHHRRPCDAVGSPGRSSADRSSSRVCASQAPTDSLAPVSSGPGSGCRPRNCAQRCLPRSTGSIHHRRSAGAAAAAADSATGRSASRAASQANPRSSASGSPRYSAWSTPARRPATRAPPSNGVPGRPVIPVHSTSFLALRAASPSVSPVRAASSVSASQALVARRPGSGSRSSSTLTHKDRPRGAASSASAYAQAGQEEAVQQRHVATLKESHSRTDSKR